MAFARSKDWRINNSNSNSKQNKRPVLDQIGHPHQTTTFLFKLCVNYSHKLLINFNPLNFMQITLLTNFSKGLSTCLKNRRWLGRFETDFINFCLLVNLYGPFCKWAYMGLPLQGDRRKNFSPEFPGIPGIHFIDLLQAKKS